MPSSATCPVPTCIDSRLTTAASVFGIMTFIYGVLAGLSVAWLQVMTLETDLKELLLSFESTDRQLANCDRKLHEYHALHRNKVEREDAEPLQWLLKQGHDIMMEIRHKRGTVDIFRSYSRWRKLRSMIYGKVLKDDMTGKVKNAQRILSEIQLGMIQLKQDIINADQITRSEDINRDQIMRTNALLKMVLNRSERPTVDELETSNALFKMSTSTDEEPDAEKLSPTESLHNPDIEESSPGFEDVFDTMKRPKHRVTDVEQIPPRAEEERSTAILRSQIERAKERKKSVAVTDNDGDVDQLGALLRARTMSIAQGQVEKEDIEEGSDEIAPS